MTLASPVMPRPKNGRHASSSPRWLLIPASIGIALILVPILAIVLRVSWDEFPALVTSPSSVSALMLSLRTAGASTVLCVVLGVPMALVLARLRFRGHGVLRSLVLLPMVMPPVVGGVALLYTFGRQGLLGESMSALGIHIAYSTTAVVLAQTFVAMPFLVITVENALHALDPHVIEAAVMDGAGPTAVLRTIMLPLIMPGLISGAILAFARALGEFGATIAFAGSLEGVTRTLPLEIYLQRETDPDAAVALSLLLIAAAVLVVGLAGARRPAV